MTSKIAAFVKEIKAIHPNSAVYLEDIAEAASGMAWVTIEKAIYVCENGGPELIVDMDKAKEVEPFFEMAQAQAAKRMAEVEI